MSSSYIPEDSYAVCTYQMGASPQKFIACRDKISGFHKDKPLLTVADKNLDVQFTCKSPISLGAALLAFGAGLVLVASGPVGWAIAGAALVGGAIFLTKAISHKCTSPLKTGQWMLCQPDVEFNGENAITQESMLSCSNGGILKPFFSYSLACCAAKKISKNNWAEVGVTAIISFFAGYFLLPTLGNIKSVKAGGKFFLTNVMGLGVTWTLQYTQREYIRNDKDLTNNQVYKNLNEVVDENSFIQEIKDPSSFNDLEAVFLLQNAINEGKIVFHNLRLIEKLSYFSKQTTGTLKKNPAYNIFLNDVGKGVYGDPLKQSMLNISGKLKANNSSVRNGMNFSKNNFNSSFKSMAKTSFASVLFLLPLVGTFFSENGRKAFASEAIKDMTNGINVTTQAPLGNQ